MIQVVDLQNMIENVRFCLTTCIRIAQKTVSESLEAFSLLKHYFKEVRMRKNSRSSLICVLFCSIWCFHTEGTIYEKCSKLKESENILQQTIFTSIHKHLNDNTDL